MRKSLAKTSFKSLVNYFFLKLQHAIYIAFLKKSQPKSYTMEKYENFKTFLLQNDQISTTYKQALSMCPYEIFLGAIKLHRDNGLSQEEIAKIACEKAGIDLQLIEEEYYSKFNRYIKFFITCLDA